MNYRLTSSLELLTKSGAILSSIGIALFVMFVAILLVFQVIKECDNNGKCSFSSTAPELLKPLVQPAFLALSIAIIATGVFMLRFGRWRDSKKS